MARTKTGLLLALAWLAAAPAAAEPLPDSFPIGSGAGLLCSAQTSGRDSGLADMFDRAFAITCRDAVAPVGRLYILRLRGGDPAARLAAIRGGTVDCGPPDGVDLESLGRVDTLSCRLKGADVAYRVYSRQAGSNLYVAEGFAGYDSALRLGLRSLVAGRPAVGEVSIATTGAGDPAAFARAQAGSLDPARALTEAYRRNNQGNFAEAAEFFAALLVADPNGSGRVEALLNQALQQSNLGAADQAAILFGRAEASAGIDPVLTRMLRNYRAIHLMNQQASEAALAQLDRPLPPGAEFGRMVPGEALIDSSIAAQLNADPPAARGLRGAASALLPIERVRILDAQADHLRGALLGKAGRPGESAASLRRALGALQSVREGRVISTLWLRAQIHGELGAIAERRGDKAGAEREHKAAIALLEAEQPGSPAQLSAKARLAAFLGRSGRTEDSLALYRQIVDANAASGEPSPALRRALGPYFALLVSEADRPGAAADMFKASQLLIRPGVAQTQAVLARELSGGSGEASRLFRQSVDLSREIERARAEAARLSALPTPTAEGAVRLAALQEAIPQMETAQVATQSKLAHYPRYRIVSGGALALAELQQILRPGEAYYKMVVAGADLYAIFATPGSSRIFRIGISPADLEREVDALRSTISRVEGGQVLTYPFDAELAHRLFGQLFGPVAGELGAVRHLIFEPDGAMLRLPPNLLITDRSGVDAYLVRSRRPGDDGFDLTGINWLGRGRQVSTAVSARAFRDVRQAPPSRAAKNYLGFGENRPPESEKVTRSAVRTLLGDDPSCGWSLTQWTRPISAAELQSAETIVERRGGSGTEIVTGAQFSDSAIKDRSDLGQYRILHFATHGLVTAPRPECQARPALMTSFGGPGSDGLLSFNEIYDLRIDADLVILSACDTAGKASLAATREAGVATGGEFALDGLVRAFVGAGARSVVASHWPVPDDYDATNRLISGLFTAPSGTSVAGALGDAQLALMDQPATSHPYYWAGFAIIGDGAAAVLPVSGP